MPEISLASPIGRLTIRATNEALTAISWGETSSPEETPLLAEARRQLSAYFAGALTVFDLPFELHGSAFQKSVWNLMCRIPAGSVRTYGEIGAELGAPARAVGGACGRNPLPIIVPCHRIIAANGNLGGYSGGRGVATKRYLLALEKFETRQLDLFGT